MGSCIVLAPIVVAAWPALSAAAISAATALGYTIVGTTAGAIATAATENHMDASSAGTTSIREINLEIPNSTVVTDQLGRDQRITMTRDGITITFSRDARGKALLHVRGDGYSKEQLQAMGKEFSQRVVQQYTYRKLLGELASRQFLVVEEEAQANQSIRIKVRHWEN